MRSSFSSVNARSQISCAARAFARPPKREAIAATSTVRTLCRPRRAFTRSSRSTDSSTCRSGISPDSTAALIAANAASASGTSSTWSTPAFTAIAAAWPFPKFLEIANIDIESV